ncbi:putative mediator of RNA polymerase II transcription subunit 12 [Aplysia californica]|uniref:Mediator of RNA polymerase II transcription subunit 12 n=1 Tax=Aplysia californica TaxID=6500 RepID=A0ABM1W3P6_APLCA|nr:putative mediator of RNA polymerase II transcription subunit 12 [Aplysia californica]
MLSSSKHRIRLEEPPQHESPDYRHGYHSSLTAGESRHWYSTVKPSEGVDDVTVSQQKRSERELSLRHDRLVSETVQHLQHQHQRHNSLLQLPESEHLREPEQLTQRHFRDVSYQHDSRVSSEMMRESQIQQKQQKQEEQQSSVIPSSEKHSQFGQLHGQSQFYESVPAKSDGHLPPPPPHHHLSRRHPPPHSKQLHHHHHQPQFDHHQRAEDRTYPRQQQLSLEVQQSLSLHREHGYLEHGSSKEQSQYQQQQQWQLDRINLPDDYNYRRVYQRDYTDLRTVEHSSLDRPLEHSSLVRLLEHSSLDRLEHSSLDKPLERSSLERSSQDRPLEHSSLVRLLEHSSLDRLEHSSLDKPLERSSLERSSQDRPLEHSSLVRLLEHSSLDRLEHSSLDKPLERSSLNRPLERSSLVRLLEHSTLDRPLEHSILDRQERYSQDRPLENSSLDRLLEHSNRDRRVERSSLDRRVERSSLTVGLAELPETEARKAYSPSQPHHFHHRIDVQEAQPQRDFHELVPATTSTPHPHHHHYRQSYHHDHHHQRPSSEQRHREEKSHDKFPSEKSYRHVSLTPSLPPPLPSYRHHDIHHHHQRPHHPQRLDDPPQQHFYQLLQPAHEEAQRQPQQGHQHLQHPSQQQQFHPHLRDELDDHYHGSPHHVIHSQHLPRGHVTDSAPEGYGQGIGDDGGRPLESRRYHQLTAVDLGPAQGYLGEPQPKPGVASGTDVDVDPYYLVPL